MFVCVCVCLCEQFYFLWAYIWVNYSSNTCWLIIMVHIIFMWLPSGHFELHIQFFSLDQLKNRLIQINNREPHRISFLVSKAGVKMHINIGGYIEDTLSPHMSHIMSSQLCYLVNQGCCLHFEHIVQSHQATCLFSFHPQLQGFPILTSALQKCPYKAHTPNLCGSSHSLSNLISTPNLETHQSMKI